MTIAYIPPTTSGLDAWSANFSSLISAAPATYGLTAGDAATIAAAVAGYHAAYLLAGTAPPHNTPVNPAARTPVTVANMRSQQGAMVPLLRAYASQIVKNPGVLNSDKVALGLNLPNTTPSPVPPPVSNPMISILQQNHLIIQLSTKDSLTPVGKAKAPGAIQMQLVGGFGTPLPTNPDLMPTLATPTKSPFQLAISVANLGLPARLWGRWVTRKGLTGPWSPAVDFIVT